LPKKFQSQNVSRKKLRKTLLYEKGLSKMLMKLTPADFDATIFRGRKSVVTADL